MEQRLSVVTLGVADLGRARRFYEEGLGWSAAPTGETGVVFFQLVGMVLALFPRDALAADAAFDSTPAPGSGSLTLAYNTRAKDEVADVLAAAVAAGATLLKPAEDTFWGGHGGYFADPDGHVWEVAWNPFWTVREDGAIDLAGPG